MNRAQIVLLAGPVGVGKTTVAERVVGLARRRGLVCAGLLAPALMNSCGRKAGIWGVDILSGERRILARTDRNLHGPEVGPYSFDAAVLAWAVEVVERAMGTCDLLVLDEMGRLELECDVGLAPLLPRLASGEASRSLVLVRTFLLARLQDRLVDLHSDHGAVEQIVFQVSAGNRRELPLSILERLLLA